MAGEHGEGIAYKGLTMHKAKRWNTVTGKVLCAVMFWVLYRAKQDGLATSVGGPWTRAPGIPMKNEDEWPSMKVFVDELLVMSSGIALFFVHFSKLLAEKDS